MNRRQVSKEEEFLYLSQEKSLSNLLIDLSGRDTTFTPSEMFFKYLMEDHMLWSLDITKRGDLPGADNLIK